MRVPGVGPRGEHGGAARSTAAGQILEGQLDSGRKMWEGGQESQGVEEARLSGQQS